MSEKQSGRWKSFALAFALTLALLSAIMITAVMAVQPLMPGGSRNAPSQAQEPLVLRPQAEDSLTMVVIGMSGETPSDFLLIRFNPQYGQVPLSLLSADTLVTVNGEGMTLAQAYLDGGGETVKSGLSERLGIVIDRYARINSDAFIRIAEKTGTVLFTMPYEVAYSRNGYNIKIPAGERRMDGKDIADLFAYPGWKDKPLEKSKLMGDLVSAIINQNLDAASDPVSSGLFKLAINLVDTDITFADYEYRRDAADFVSKLDAQVAGNLVPTGTFLNDGKHLELSEEYVEMMQKYYEAQ